MAVAVTGQFGHRVVKEVVPGTLACIHLDEPRIGTRQQQPATVGKAQGVGGRRIDKRHGRHLRLRLLRRLKREGGRQRRRNPLNVALVQRGHRLLVALAGE